MEELKWFSGAFIFVEWFYVFSGYTLGKRVLESKKTTEVAETSFNIIWKRIVRIYPYYFLSCVLALIFKIYTGEIIIKNSWDVYAIAHDFLFLQMTGIEIKCLTGIGWYLSSLWIGMIVVVPLLVKYRRFFSKLGIFIAIIIYIYIFSETGCIYEPDKWMTLGYKGNFRAIAALCLGISIYDYSSLIKSKLSFENVKAKLSILLNVLALCAYGVILYYVNKIWVDSSIMEMNYFIIPFPFAILIAIQMNNELLPDNKITQFMGAFSMTIYMNHYYIQEAIQVMHKDTWTLDKKIVFSLILSFLISMMIYLLVLLRKYVKNMGGQDV